MANESFETIGTEKGLADSWTLARRSEREEVCMFDGVTDFEYAEDFEQKWTLPRPLLASLKYNEDSLFAFDETSAAVESGSAETYTISVGDDLDIVVDGGASQNVVFDGDETTAEDVVRTINDKSVGLTASTSSSDTKVTLTSDTEGLGSSIQVTGGTANTELNFPTTAEFGSGVLEGNAISGDDEETFEYGWDIASLLGATQPEQADQVTTDGALWPSGHLGFLDDLALIGVEEFEFTFTPLPGFSPLQKFETFEDKWLLPGSVTGLFNDDWFDKFYDLTNSEFRFLVSHLENFEFDAANDDFEDFEEEWRDNENSIFAFTGGTLESFTFTGPASVETFESGWTLTLP